MRKRTFYPLSLAIGCLLIMAGATTAACAQQPMTPTTTPTPTATSPSNLVAVVDISKVFDEHHSFKATMEGIQQQGKTAERELEAKRRELNALSKELDELNPASPDYRRKEAELARKMADLQVKARQAKKDFMQREALQYYSAYKEILAAVNKVAERYNIGLVLRYDSSQIDPNNPQSVALGMSRSVVVQRNLDITSHVIQELKVALAQKDNPNAPRR